MRISVDTWKYWSTNRNGGELHSRVILLLTSSATKVRSAVLNSTPWSTIALEGSLRSHPTLRPAWTHLGIVPSLQECLAATSCWQSGGTCQASSTASFTFTWPTETCLEVVPRFGRREPIPPNTLTLPKSVLSYAVTVMAEAIHHQGKSQLILRECLQEPRMGNGTQRYLKENENLEALNYDNDVPPVENIVVLVAFATNSKIHRLWYKSCETP